MNQRVKQILYRLIPNDKQLKNIGLLAGSTVIGQIFLVLTSPIISRLYSQAELGMFGLVTTFSSIVSVAITLKYELAIVSAETEQDAIDLMVFSIFFSIIFSLLSGLGLFSLIYYNFFNFGVVSYYLIPVILLLNSAISISLVFRYWFTRKEMFGIIGKINLWQGFGRGIGQIILSPFSGVGLILGETFGRNLGFTLSWKESHINKHIRDTLIRKDDAINTLKKYKTFPMFVLPSSIIDITSIMMPLPIISGLYGLEAAGLYSLAQRVMTVPLSLIGSSVADVFYSQIADLQRSDREKIMPAFWVMTRSLILIGIVPTVILSLLGESIFKLVFGIHWSQSGAMIALMSPWMLAQFVVSPISRIVLISNKQGVKLFYDLTAFFIILIVPYWIHRNGGSVLEALFWLSLCKALAYVLYFLIVWGQARQISLGRIG
jgi:O-antigen/teichoic acid export membrane protein